jgi:hypothetical protein
MFLGITPHDSRQAVFPYWAIGQGQGLKIWSKKYKSKEKNLNVFFRQTCMNFRTGIRRHAFLSHTMNALQLHILGKKLHSFHI